MSGPVGKPRSWGRSLARASRRGVLGAALVLAPFARRVEASDLRVEHVLGGVTAVLLEGDRFGCICGARGEAAVASVDPENLRLSAFFLPPGPTRDAWGPGYDSFGELRWVEVSDSLAQEALDWWSTSGGARLSPPDGVRARGENDPAGPAWEFSLEVTLSGRKHGVEWTDHSLWSDEAARTRVAEALAGLKAVCDRHVCSVPQDEAGDAKE